MATKFFPGERTTVTSGRQVRLPFEVFANGTAGYVPVLEGSTWPHTDSTTVVVDSWVQDAGPSLWFDGESPSADDGPELVRLDPSAAAFRSMVDSVANENADDALAATTVHFGQVWGFGADPTEGLVEWLGRNRSPRGTVLMMTALGASARADGHRVETVVPFLENKLTSAIDCERLGATHAIEALRFPRLFVRLGKASKREPQGYIAGLQRRIAEMFSDAPIDRASMVPSQDRLGRSVAQGR